MRITRLIPALAIPVLLVACDQQPAALDQEVASLQLKKAADMGPIVGVALGAPGAIVERFEVSDETCGFFWDGDGDLLGWMSCQVVRTPAAGLASQVIRVWLDNRVPNSTGRAVRYDASDNPEDLLLCYGFDAGDGFIFTYHWYQIVSASGKTTAVCVFGPHGFTDD